jgi:FkbM family methyltransferase
MQIDPRDTHFTGPVKDPSTYQFSQYNAGVKHTARRRTAIDVGAHIGIFTQRYAQLFQRVIAIEPVNVQYLRANTVQYANVEIYHNAASNRIGDTVYLHNPSHNNSNSGAWEITTEPTDTSITTITVDSLNIKDVDLIKIDTQGVEHSVILGARDTIKQCRPVIHIESRDTDLIEYICNEYDYVVQTTVIKDRILVPKKRR